VWLSVAHRRNQKHRSITRNLNLNNRRCPPGRGGALPTPAVECRPEQRRVGADRAAAHVSRTAYEASSLQPIASLQARTSPRPPGPAQWCAPRAVAVSRPAPATRWPGPRTPGAGHRGREPACCIRSFDRLDAGWCACFRSLATCDLGTQGTPIALCCTQTHSRPQASDRAVARLYDARRIGHRHGVVRVVATIDGRTEGLAWELGPRKPVWAPNAHPVAPDRPRSTSRRSERVSQLAVLVPRADDDARTSAGPAHHNRSRVSRGRPGALADDGSLSTGVACGASEPRRRSVRPSRTLLGGRRDLPTTR
jgi:hypothetical protein